MNPTLTEAPSPPAVAPPEVEPRRTLQGELFRFSERFGHLMSRILLTLLYVFLVAPAGIVLALFGDPLGIRRYRGSSWTPWTSDNETPEQARRQD